MATNGNNLMVQAKEFKITAGELIEGVRLALNSNCYLNFFILPFNVDVTRV